MHPGYRRDLDFVEVAQRGITLLDTFRKQFGKRGVRYGEEVSIRGLFPALVKADSGELAIFDFQPTHWRAQNYFSAATLNLPFAAIVQICERHRGDSHTIADAIGKKGLPENVHPEARIGAIQFLVKSAHEDNTPESLDGALGLAATAEPFEHGDSSGVLKFRRPALAAENIDHGPRNSDLIQQGHRHQGRKSIKPLKCR